jgi:tripartite ATP-independent transporter DctM subunit
MTIEVIVVVILGMMLVSFALGAHVGFSLGGIALGVGYFSWGPQIFKLIPTTVLTSLSNFLLLAIPLFIFMGQMLYRSGLGEAMFQSAYVLAGRLAGGLAVGVMLVCALIGAMVGIVGAGIMTAGTVALPPMLQRAYNKRLALGTIMAGGALGILIPPSIPMILYAAITKVSLGKLFAAALVPAAMLVLLHVTYIVVRCMIRPGDGPSIPQNEQVTGLKKVKVVGKGLSSISLIVIVLGSILFGVATPTEAGAIGAIGAGFMALFYRQFGFSEFWEGSLETARLTGIVVWMLIGATLLTNFNLLMGISGLVTSHFESLGLGPLGTVILMNVIMFLMGFILDEYIIVLIAGPIFVPIVIGMGLDPVWFGILMILNLTIAVQTPPYGFALFYMKAVMPRDIPIGELYRAVPPFIAITVLVMGLCIAVPELVTWLPSKFFD